MEVVAVFDGLRVKPGWTLHAHQFRNGGNGNGFVWAMPDGVEFREPESGKDLLWTCVFSTPFAYLQFRTPKPPDALPNFMEAIEGDGSAFSFLCASILARELREFGAMWHGRFWNDVELKGDDPEVVEDEDEIKVFLNCYTRLGTEGTFTYVDRYQRGGYTFETETINKREIGPGFHH